MIPTYFLVRRIESRDARAHSVERAAAAAAASATFDPSRPRRAARAASYVAVGPLLYVGLGAVPSLGSLNRSPDALDVAAPWVVSERAAGDVGWTPAFSGIDQSVQWTIVLPEATVEAGRYFFTDQRQGEEMIQYGNAIAPDSLLASERLIGPVGARRRYVREAILLDGGTPRVAWYWYRVAGVDTPFPSRAKLLEVLAFALRRPAAELITLSAPCAPDDCTVAAQALRTALGASGGP
jgi:hypothetical protein